MSDLEDILAGKEPEPQEPEVIEQETEEATPEAKSAEAENVETEAPPADEPTGEEDSGTPPQKESKEVPLTALLDERDKRKEASRRAEELEKQIQELQKPKESPDFWENPQTRT